MSSTLDKILPPEDRSTEVDEADVAAKSSRSVKAAVAARIAGASYAEIAELFDYRTPASARQAVETAIAAAYDDGESIEGLRNMAQARLETLLKSLAPRALSDKVRVKRTVNGKEITEVVDNTEHLAYAREFRATVDRLIMLNGLNAPQVHRFETPDAAMFNEVLAVVQRAKIEGQAPEADIFDAEVVEDDDDEAAS